MKKLFYLSAAALFLLAGCQSELTENGPLQSDAGLKIMTRATETSGFTETSWADGDKIGMIISGEDSQKFNFTYEWNQTDWTLKTDPDFDKNNLKDGMSIIAINPFDGTSFENIGFTLPLEEEQAVNDQSTPELQKKSDFLVAESILALYSNTIDLNFIHKMAKLVVKFDYQYDGFDVYENPKEVVMYDMPTAYSYTTETGWTPSGSASVIPFVEDMNTVTAYIVPHTIKAGKEFMSLLTSIINDKEQTTSRTHRISLDMDLDLKEGCSYEINVTIK